MGKSMPLNSRLSLHGNFGLGIESGSGVQTQVQSPLMARDEGTEKSMDVRLKI